MFEGIIDKFVGNSTIFSDLRLLSNEALLQIYTEVVKAVEEGKQLTLLRQAVEDEVIRRKL